MMYYLIKAMVILFTIATAFLIVGVIFGAMLLHAKAIEPEFAVERIWVLLKLAGLTCVISIIWDMWAKSMKGI